MLAWTIYISFAGALVLALLPKGNGRGGDSAALARRVALAVGGISRVLVLLTGLAAVAGVLFSWNFELRTNEFFAFFLALIGGVYGVFLSFDLFLLFVFYEIAIVPKYFLIAIWGSSRAA